MIMVLHGLPVTIERMMHMRISLPQVIAGIIATVSFTATVILYGHSTFETKSDAAAKHAAVEDQHRKDELRMDRFENIVTKQNDLQSQIAIDVREIRTRIEYIEKRK